MKKLRLILILLILPFIVGYGLAYLQNQKNKVKNENSTFNLQTGSILPNDTVTLTSQGNIYTANYNGLSQITQNKSLTEPVVIGNDFFAIQKQTNYSSLVELNNSGGIIKTIINGNTGNVDTDIWAGEPAVSKDKEKLAFVSDKNRIQTQISDNVLYEKNLKSGETITLAKPNPGSGGIAHPVWNPIDPNTILYDFYAYNQNMLPYSVIVSYDIQTDARTPLTSEKDNAYQASFSPDGKKLIYLERNSDYSVTMYLADFTSDGLKNIKKIATGNFSFPTFSNTKNHIYFFSAQGNEGYNLFTANIINGKLSDIIPLTGDSQFTGNEGFSVNKSKE